MIFSVITNKELQWIDKKTANDRQTKNCNNIESHPHMLVNTLYSILYHFHFHVGDAGILEKFD